MLRADAEGRPAGPTLTLLSSRREDQGQTVKQVSCHARRALGSSCKQWAVTEGFTEEEGGGHSVKADMNSSGCEGWGRDCSDSVTFNCSIYLLW